MEKEKISRAQADLAVEAMDAKNAPYLSRFLDFSGMEKRERASFIYYMSEYGLHNLSEATQNQLATWATRLQYNDATLTPAQQKGRDGGIKQSGRRWAMKRLMALGIIAGKEGLDIADNQTVKTLEDAGAALVAARVLANTQAKTEQAEAIFREKLPAWLKYRHKMDFTFPPIENPSRNR